MDPKFRLGEADLTTYRVGERLIGVRTTDGAVGARLREVLARQVVEGVDAPPNLSLIVGSDAGPVHDFHWLYGGTTSIARARSVGRLIRAAVLNLADFQAIREPHVAARLVVRDGTAVLVDPWLGSELDRIEHRLARSGARMADLAAVRITPDGWDAVLPPPLDVESTAYDALTAAWPLEATEFRPVPGPLRVGGLVVLVPPTEPALSSAAAVEQLARLVCSASPAPLGLEDVTLAQRLVHAWVVQPCPSDAPRLLEVVRELLAT